MEIWVVKDLVTDEFMIVQGSGRFLFSHKSFSKSVIAGTSEKKARVTWRKFQELVKSAEDAHANWGEWTRARKLALVRYSCNMGEVIEEVHSGNK